MEILLLLVLAAMCAGRRSGAGKGFKAIRSARARALLRTPEGRDHIRRISRG